MFHTMSTNIFPIVKLRQFFDQSKKGKNIWKSSFFIMISQSVSVAIFLIADMIFARRFSTTDFATWKQVMLLVNLGIPLISFGLPEGFKYYAAKDGENIGIHLVRSLIATTLLSLAILSFMYLGGSELLVKALKNPDIRYFKYGTAVIFMAVIFSKLVRYFLINNDFTSYLFNSAILSLILGSAQLAYIYFNYGKISPQTLWTVITFMICLIFLSSVITIFFKEGLTIFKHGRAEKSSLFQFTPYFKIGLPLYIATFIGVITLNLDKAIVNSLGTLNDFAIYSVGAIEIPLFSMLSSAVAQSIFPKLVAFYKEQNIEQAKLLWINTTKKISYMSYPIILVLMIFASPLIKLVFTTRYEAAIPIFKTYLLVSLWRNNYYGSLISASGKTKWITFYSFINFVLNIGFSVLLYYFNGLIGIAYGALIAASVAAFWQLKHESLIVPWLKHILLDKIILSFILLILAAYFFL